MKLSAGGDTLQVFSLIMYMRDIDDTIQIWKTHLLLLLISFLLCAFLVWGWCWQAPNFSGVPTPGYSWLHKAQFERLPRRNAKAEVFYSVPESKEMMSPFSVRQKHFHPQYQFVQRRHYTPATLMIKQMMIEHIVIFTCMSHGCKTWFWFPEWKVTSHNRSDTSTLSIF